MDGSYFLIIALLPLAAVILIIQVNPYNALVMRGILGAIAALVYAILGAADVALTEALVGTMLAITLYVVAVRSSLVMRVGVLKDGQTDGQIDKQLSQLIADLKRVASQYHLQVELVPYPDPQSLEQALFEKEVHATCIECLQLGEQPAEQLNEQQPYRTTTRIRRLHNIFQTELVSPMTTLVYRTASASGEKD